MRVSDPSPRPTSYRVPPVLRELRLEYLPPLMVYLAAGLSGITSIVGTFFVKDTLGLSATFLASIGFWAGIPWALKMPMGHLVDLFWRWKAGFVVLGASLIAASLSIMLGLVAGVPWMLQWLNAPQWYVCSALLAPIGYMMQDTVADAMTVEAVPRVDARGIAYSPAQRRAMNTTMQTLGRVAIIGGGVLVSLLNIVMFSGVDHEDAAALRTVYIDVYQWALVIPVLSLAGIALAAWLRARRARSSALTTPTAAGISVEPSPPAIAPNWWILGGSAVFVALTLTIGLASFTYGEELIFGGSLLTIGILMWRLLRELTPDARRTLLGTATIIFIFRAMPGPGAGSTWWMIDTLGFDQAFLARLSLVASVLTLIGLFAFRRLMAERSVAYVVGFLSLASFVLGLPTVGMYYGLHQWTAALTGGVIDARFIALVDTALESPLGQISMVPLLAWIANSAPAHLKATYFAVMASFTNLALSAAQLGTKYLNQIFVVTREVHGAGSVPATPADYSQLGHLLLIASALTLLPLVAIALTRALGIKTE